jgi:hypothetical protein
LHACSAYRNASATRACRQTLRNLLDEYKQEAGLAVHMVLMGPSGLEHRPRTGGVLPYYDQCHKEPERMVKTIANTYFLTGLAVHPHNFWFRCGAPCWQPCEH